jgi:type II secretory pathway pseudopilin PulG
MVVLAALALIGLVAAFLLPRGTAVQATATEPSAERHRFA